MMKVSFLLFLFSQGLFTIAQNQSDINEEGTTLHYAIPKTSFPFSEFSHWNQSNYGSNLILTPLHASLFRRSNQLNHSWEGWLAMDNPQRSPDNLIWTIELKDDLLFSNGRTLTASDIIFSYKVGLTPAIADQTESHKNIYEVLSYFFNSNSSVALIDDKNIQFTFQQISSNLISSVFTIPIIEELQYGDIYNSCLSGINSDCRWDDQTGLFAKGAGPYTLGEIDNQNKQLKMVKNNHYVFDDVYFDNIVFTQARSKNEVLTEFKNGMYDIVDFQYNFNQTDVSTIQIDDIVTSADPSFKQVLLNHQHPYFGTGDAIPDIGGKITNDQEQALLLRQALSHITDVEAYISDSLHELATPLSTIFPVTSPMYNSNLEPIENSIETARMLMEEIGFDYAELQDLNNDGDYIDPKETQFFNISILTFDFDTDSIAYSTIMRQNLGKIGIGTYNNSISQLDPNSVLFRTYYYPKPELIPEYIDGGYDIWVFNEIGTWDPFEFLPGTKFTSDGLCTSPNLGICWNVMNYVNPQLEEIIDQYEATFEEEELFSLAYEIQDEFYENVPSLPLFSRQFMWLVNNELQNFDPLMTSFFMQHWDKINLDQLAQEPENGLSENFNIWFVVIPIAILVLGLIWKRFRK